MRGEPEAWFRTVYAGDPGTLVSVTRRPTLATYYAGLWTVNPWHAGDGYVYKIEPADEPVFVRGWDEWTTSEAVVLEVVESGVSTMRACNLPGDGGMRLQAEAYLWQVWRACGKPLPAPERVIVRQRDPGVR
jgi:hypothetical protein